MNKVSKLLLSTVMLMTLCSCSENIDQEVAYTFDINCGFSYKLDINKYNQIVNFEALNASAIQNKKKIKVKNTDLNATLNNILDKSTTEAENEVLFSFYSNCNKTYSQSIINMFCDSSYVIVGQLIEDEENTDINNVAAIYGLNYGFAKFERDLSYDYPQIDVAEIVNMTLEDQFTLFAGTHTRTKQAYLIYNLENEIDVTSEKAKAIQFFKENTSYTNVVENDLVIKSYMYKDAKYVCFALYKEGLQAYVEYCDNIEKFYYVQEGLVLTEGRELYDEYKVFIDGIVEPFVNLKSSEILGTKFKAYRDYIYDYLRYDGKIKLKTLSFKQEALVYEYLLDKLDCYKEDVKHSIVEFYTAGPDRYYIASIFTESDYYVVLGNAFSCQVMKIYKNKEVKPFTVEVTLDPDFSLETISGQTKGGQY